jgi:hypothetical protein
MRTIPFVGVQPHNRQRYPTAYLEALQRAARMAPFQPDFFVPGRQTQFRHPIAAARVIAAAREVHERMAAAGRWGEVRPTLTPRPAPPPYPSSNARMYHGRPPGFDVPNIPFDPRGHLPMAAQVERQRITQLAQLQARAQGASTMTAMDDRVRQLSHVFAGDPVTGERY